MLFRKLNVLARLVPIGLFLISKFLVNPLQRKIAITLELVMILT